MPTKKYDDPVLTEVNRMFFLCVKFFLSRTGQNFCRRAREIGWNRSQWGQKFDATEDVRRVAFFPRFPRFPVQDCGSKSKKRVAEMLRHESLVAFMTRFLQKTGSIQLACWGQKNRMIGSDRTRTRMHAEETWRKSRFTGSPQFHTHKNEERWNCLEHQAGVESVDFLCRFSSRKCGLFRSKSLRLSPTFKVCETQVPYSYNKTHPYRFPFC